jgi:hypothetical protein
MAKGSDLVPAVTMATGAPLVTVQRAYRFLQNSGKDRCPKGTRGSGPYLAPDIETRHARNLLLGLSASPVASAPSWVDELAAMKVERVYDPSITSHRPPPGTGTFSIGGLTVAGTFGETVDALIEQANAPETADLIQGLTIEVMVRGTSVVGSIKFLYEGGAPTHSVHYMRAHAPAADADAGGPLVAGMSRITRFEGSSLQVIGAVLATPSPTKETRHLSPKAAGSCEDLASTEREAGVVRNRVTRKAGLVLPG